MPLQVSKRRSEHDEAPQDRTELTPSSRTGIGLAASLIGELTSWAVRNHQLTPFFHLTTYYNDWPGSLGGWTKAVLAFVVSATALSMLFLLGQLFSRDIFGNVLTNTLVFFPIWVSGSGGRT